MGDRRWRLPGRLMAGWAVLMLVDVVVFRAAEAADPGRTLRHAGGAVLVGLLAWGLARGRRGSWLASLVLVSVYTMVAAAGTLFVLTHGDRAGGLKGYPAPRAT